MKQSYSYLVEKPGRSYELAKQMIPILISWAQEKRSPQYYSTLSKTIGHNTARIGRQLGVIGRILIDLKNESGENVPLLNALVINKGSKIPSGGLSEFIDGYDKWSEKKKRQAAEKTNDKAYSYKNWPWVLNALGLMPYNGSTEESIRKGLLKKDTSEGPYHKALKEHILEHPKLFSITNVKEKENEHILLSGDRLDVFFRLKDNKQVAIEVKSRISDDADILRGIFQCVKYKAVMSAECFAKGQKADVDSFLVIENEMSEDNRKTANMLSVKYIVYDKLK
ncbi:MAG: hypothetical protein IKX65_02195 [Prevotella sp.]|nr:hypothetical protein [Prevotella sp.]